MEHWSPVGSASVGRALWEDVLRGPSKEELLELQGAQGSPGDLVESNPDLGSGEALEVLHF